MQSGSNSRSARNRGAVVEADTIGEHAAVEADAIEEQQPKRTQSRSSSRSGRNRGAVEIREEQLKRTQAVSSN